MNRIRPIAWVILLLAAVLLGWQWTHRNVEPPPARGVSKDGEGADAQPQMGASHARNSTKMVVTESSEEVTAKDATSATAQAHSPAPTPSAPVEDTAESTTLPAATILENMRTSIRQYASTLGENPVGTNPEITSSLHGGNPKHIDFLKDDGNRVNANGELVDTWGTPYFFHQLSAHDMEIRSAGPDRIMYTGDDLVIR